MKHTLLFGVMILLFAGCEQDAKFKEYVYPVPVVSEIYPATGYVGSQVAILGTDLNDRVEAVQVFFGGVEATVISCVNNRIIVEVPRGAQSGDVSLRVWTYNLASAGQFVVMPTPQIEKIVSNNAGGTLFAQGGDQITISGTAFGTVPEDVSVTINGVPAEIVSLLDHQIIAEVPANYGSGLVVVNVKGYQVEGTALIDPSTEGDVTHLFLKNYKQPFQRSDTGEGEWGTARYWSGTAKVTGVTGYMNMSKSLRFDYDSYPNGVIALDGEANHWDGFYGGTMYQITTLPVGTYTFSVTVVEDYFSTGRYGAIFGVIKGEAEFPVMLEHNPGGAKYFTYTNPNGTVLTQVNLANYGRQTVPYTYTCVATLTETTIVSVALGKMMAAGNYTRISEIKIERAQ